MTAATTPAEVRGLAEELAVSYRRTVEGYQRDLGQTREEALASAEEGNSEAVTRGLGHGPEHLDWWQFRRVANADPERALAEWEQLKQRARDELESGLRAARGLEPVHSSPWERAQFLAVRDALRAEWQPRPGSESLLVDSMAQAVTMQERWQELAIIRSFHDLDVKKLREEEQERRYGIGSSLPPRVNEFQAIEQANAMVERCQRMFLRALRALRDLRRYGVPLQVHAQQVNIAQQQAVVNVGEA